MEAFSLGVRERREGVHKTGVGGCIHRMIRANRLKVARVSNDLRDFRQFFQLVGHETVVESDSVDLWKRGDSNRWAVGWCVGVRGHGFAGAGCHFTFFAVHDGWIVERDGHDALVLREFEINGRKTERCTVLEAKGEEMMRMICERSPKSTLFSSR